VILVCFDDLQEFDENTSAGKLFRVCAAATGNARSPTVKTKTTTELHRTATKSRNDVIQEHTLTTMAICCTSK